MNNVLGSSVKKICFVGLYNVKNLGDPIIAYCTEWLFKKHLPIQSTYQVTLDYAEKNMNWSFIHRLERKLYKLTKTQNKINFGIYLESKKYFKKQLKGADLIVVVGGGLIKYKYQHFHEHLSALIDVAEKMNIPVVLNAVGVEGYDDKDECCQFLKKHLNSSCVKHISIRDDIDTFNKYYLDDNHLLQARFVCDPAVWTAVAYNIKKDLDSNTIGIGIARGAIFIDNGINYTKEELLNLYVDIVTKLKKEGYEVILFTNGLKADNDQLFKVKKKLLANNINTEHLIPENAESLVKIISGFKAIIATRLHSCIVSYSLDIPAVGLVWNDKFSFWGENIGTPECFITVSDLKPEIIIEKLRTAIKGGYNQKRKELFRRRIVEDISELSTYWDVE